MAVRRFVVTIATDTSGDGSGYTPFFSGKICQISYIKAGSSNYENGVDFTCTLDTSGETVWDEDNVNATAHRLPRVGNQTSAGAASLYAAGGTAVNDYIRVARDRVKIVVAQAGSSAHTGAFHVTVED